MILTKWKIKKKTGKKNLVIFEEWKERILYLWRCGIEEKKKNQEYESYTYAFEKLYVFYVSVTNNKE